MFFYRRCRHHNTRRSSITINFSSDRYYLARETIRLRWVSMGITFMILPKLQICPRAPKLQEILRGRDCLRSEEYRVMDETIKMTPLVKLKAGCCCLRCVVRMIDVRAMASRPWVILWVQHETLHVAGWLHPWLVSPVR